MIEPRARAELLAMGFVPTTYDGQEGEFLVIRVPIGCMKAAADRLVDDDYIFATSEAVTEVTPCGQVQLYVPEGDVLDAQEPLDSDAGKLMVADAAAGVLAWMDANLSTPAA